MKTYKAKFEREGWCQFSAISLYEAYQRASRAEWCFGAVVYVGLA